MLVAAIVAVSGYRLGFAVLALPGALALLTLAWLRRAVPVPAAYEAVERLAAAPAGASGGPAARFPPRFWLYTAFTAVSMLGFATFGVLAYHLQVRHVVAPALIPVVYATAMGAAALAALACGRLYDRVGLRALVIAPPLAAVVPLFAFSTTAGLAWAGGVLWGAAMGVHESTIRAAVADLVPATRRGLGYGTFTAAYGLAWLAGSTVIGALYGHSITAAIIFTAATQALAVATLPASPDAERALRSLRNEIGEMRGSAQLLSARALVGEADVVATFNAARDEEYAEILSRCDDFLAEIERETAAGKFTYAELEENDEDLAKLRGWLEKVRARDVLGARLSDDAGRAIERCRQVLEGFAERVYAEADAS